MGKKKKPKEYKRSAAEVALDKPLTEQEVRAILSNELTFFREPATLISGYIKSGNYSATKGFRIGKDGMTLRELMQGSDPSIQGWGNTMTFSAIDADTVSWTDGTITLTDGSIYSIVTGNTGNMSALTYIYFDANVSLTVLQTTTVQATAVGRGKILVAVAQNNATVGSEATFQVFGGSGGLLLKADNIAANTITANEIAANTITASQLSVSQLSAISANLGAITAGTVTGILMTGSTIQTAATGRRIIMSTDQYLRWNSDSSTEGYIYTDSSGNMIIDADNLIYIRADGSGDDIYVVSGDVIYYEAGNDHVMAGRDGIFSFSRDFWISQCDRMYVGYNDDNDGSDCFWVSNGDTRMKLDDDGDLHIDGVFDDTGADFAELFESIDGKEIPVGVSVSLDGEKIRPAIAGENPIGVISATANLIGNAGGSDAGENWGEKYLRDDFGRYLTEEVTYWSHKKDPKFDKKGKLKERPRRIKGIVEDGEVAPDGVETKKTIRRKINPKWKKNQEYVARRKRPEWNVVGLIGRIRLRKRQPVANNWIKLRDISDEVEEWLIK
jgi:hypothetical protein